jgi:NAD(P)-dependent dehydrogenase (short-subunit alcohol dehydrogenase family)
VSALAGKVAVVTGASRGIGRAIATTFAGAGARVALLARSTDALAVVTADLARRGGTAIAVRCDVSVAAEVTAAAAQVRAALGAVDIVVNNAGSVLRKPALDIDDAEWRRVLAVNLDGTFFVTRAFGPDLVARGGRIINVASIAGRQGTPLLTAYCAAKHAVVGFTRALAEELRGAKVAVNAICPGSVDTEMLREGLPGVPPDMTPDDIARTALFLAAEAPQAMTGACIDVFG